LISRLLLMEKFEKKTGYGTGNAAQLGRLVYVGHCGRKMAMTATLKRWVMGPLLLAALLAGCASGPGGGGAASNPDGGEAKGAMVMVVGNVARSLVPWQEGLTLMQAFTLSGYQGAEEPVQLVVHRKGQLGVFVDYDKLTRGQDMLLDPGDRIDILLKRIN
jgi:hypothetical protein